MHGDLRGMKTPRFVPFLLTIALVSIGCTASDSRLEIARSALNEEFRGIIEIESFEKTDGIDVIVEGLPAYQLSYRARVRLLAEVEMKREMRGGLTLNGKRLHAFTEWMGAAEIVRAVYGPDGTFKRGTVKEFNSEAILYRTETGWKALAGFIPQPIEAHALRKLLKEPM